MNSSQVDMYMENLLSRLVQEEKDEDPHHSEHPPSSLDPFLNKLQAMLDEESSSVSSVSSSFIYLLSSLSLIVLKNSSRDNISLTEFDDVVHQTRGQIHFPSSHQPTPPTGPSSPSSPNSDSSESAESDPSSEEYSHSSPHGSHLDPPSSDDENDENVDQIPLGQKTLYADTK
jgi:cytoskeletal protein RodZ